MAMLFKLASRNIRRSMRDYAIYFITLLIGVSLFYAFNSVSGQKVVFDLKSEVGDAMFETAGALMAFFSCIIAFVLAFLIIYSNQALVRRRKQEFGVYLLLGMGAASISGIVLLETVLVGFIALGLGIVCGLLLSQLLCFLTATMFGISMANYAFVFSSQACFMTVACFILIFVLVAAFNLVVVNRFKLIDLFHAKDSSRGCIIGKPWVSLIAFIASIGVIALAYIKLHEGGMVELGTDFWIATALMLVGSLLFFGSLAGFTITVLSKSKGVYLKGIVPFTVRQVASKVNTASVSLWVVCVLLFAAFTTFSVGLTFANMLSSDTEAACPYDATVVAQTEYLDSGSYEVDSYAADAKMLESKFPESYEDGVFNGWDMASSLEEHVLGWSNMVDRSAQIDKWHIPGVPYGLLIDSNVACDSLGHSPKVLQNDIVGVSRSQYDRLLKMSGLQPLSAGEDEVALINNYKGTDSLAIAMLGSVDTLSIAGKDYKLCNEVLKTQLSNSADVDTAMVFVVPDAVIDSLKDSGMLPAASYLNLFYKGGADIEKEFTKSLEAAAKSSFAVKNGNYVNGILSDSPWPAKDLYTKCQMMEQASGLRMTFTYLALYVGLIFLVCVAAILSIRQITMAIDSQGRYRMLAKLGCDVRSLNRSLLAQIAIYFCVPLGLAICHSLCAIKVLDSARAFHALGIFGSSVVGIGLLVGVYVAYMLITYVMSRSIVRDSMR